MWVSSKEAADIFGIKYDALKKAVSRANKNGKKICKVKGIILHFDYEDGFQGGAGGKVLKIWIDEEANNVRDARVGKDSNFNKCDDLPYMEDREVLAHGQNTKNNNEKRYQTSQGNDNETCEEFGGNSRRTYGGEYKRERRGVEAARLGDTAKGFEDKKENADTYERIEDERDTYENTSGRDSEDDGERERGLEDSAKVKEYSQESTKRRDVGSVCIAGGLGRGYESCEGDNEELKVKNDCEAVSLGEQKLKMGETYPLTEAHGVGLSLNDKQDKTYKNAYLNADEEKQKEARLKLELFNRYESRGKMTTKRFLGDLPHKFNKLGFNEGKLFRLIKQVREAKSKGLSPLDVLVDKRGKGAKCRALSKEMMDFIARLMLENPARRAKKIHQYLKHEFVDVPEYSTITRYVKKWKKDNRLIYEIALNPDSAKGKFLPAFGSASENIFYKNELWELDATPADVICTDGVRYNISAAMDVYSRRVVVVVSKSNNYHTLGRVMKKGILKLGLPTAVKTDNGKEYTGTNFTYALSRLNIRQIVAPPYSGEFKPHVERFFSTLSTNLFEELDRYCGKNVSEREAIVNRKNFADKLDAIDKWKRRKVGDKEFAQLLNPKYKKQSKGKAIEIPFEREHLEAWLEWWVNEYENRLHRGINMTPLQKWDVCQHKPLLAKDERGLDLLIGETKIRVVSKKGISIDRLLYVSNDLWNRVGESVLALCDDDLGCVYVYTHEYEFITKAVCVEKSGESRQKYAEGAKSYKKAVGKFYKALSDMRKNAPDRLAEIAGLEEFIDAEVVENEKLEGRNGKGNELPKLEVANKVEEDEKTRLYSSPYERFYDCLKRGEWDELDLRIKEENEEDYLRALENYELLNNSKFA